MYVVRVSYFVTDGEPEIV